MKTVNVADLKNNLSAYLDEVEKGNQIVVLNRTKPVARLIPIHIDELSEEEERLVFEGELKLPETGMSKKFLQQILSWKLHRVSEGTSLDALVADRNEDRPTD
jgi:prevent-host-death family protein